MEESIWWKLGRKYEKLVAVQNIVSFFPIIRNRLGDETRKRRCSSAIPSGAL